ncbi:hypothetical protein HGRIS_011712 [Hohenbuehelia grisea]|uniref:Uncharacterized protein n=1 Tax=Hohenbuehelia grisea TaxID=104357 RepID=A0ABR3JVY8_9AGAR
MRWPSPLDRRELSLILFAITVFTLSYNLENSVGLLGLDPIAKQGAVFSKLGFGGKSIIAEDGRRPPEWIDSMERKILGSWGWKKGRVAGDGLERSKAKDGDQYSAMWMSHDDIAPLTNKQLDSSPAHTALDSWGSNIPTTRLIKHAAGYTILDNVFLHNGSVYLVTNFPERFPSLDSIVASENKWRVVSVEDALKTVGRYGSRIRGVSWISTDPKPDNSTLISLWRTYSTVDRAIDSQGRTTLPAPQRLIFPSIPRYSDPDPPPELYLVPRVRSAAGFHPFLAKAAFPTMGVLHKADWEDYHKMESPFVFERLVVADRAAASKSASLGQPVFTPPLELEASPYWWEPIRRTVSAWFEDLQPPPKRFGRERMEITYLHSQTEPAVARIRKSDHEALVAELKGMAHDLGHEVNIVSALEDETPWMDRMRAITRSTVLLGAHGTHLLDGAFLKRTPKTTLMELFPADSFTRERQVIARSLSMNYTAWWQDRQFSGDDLPPVSQPGDGEVAVDAKAVVRAIREILTR